jgi:hypothetical protein
MYTVVSKVADKKKGNIIYEIRSFQTDEDSYFGIRDNDTIF